MTDYVILTTENDEPLQTEDGGGVLIVSSTQTQGNNPMTANLLQFKSRQTGLAGAPTTLTTAEPAFNAVDEVLWMGIGSDIDGNATSIVPIGGRGAFTALTGDQVIAGIKTFSGELHIAVPAIATQAANKGYVDSAITLVQQALAQAMTSAMHYKGLLDASLNSLPTVRESGDLYRVSVEGNFGGATPFTASVGDHVVYNGTAWDKIDNSDPTLVGTEGHIKVTRTGENSYTIDLADTYNGGTTITSLGTITSGVWNASIIALAYGGTGADLSGAPDNTLFKKMGSSFVPAIAGTDYVKTDIGTVRGGEF